MRAYRFGLVAVLTAAVAVSAATSGIAVAATRCTATNAATATAYAALQTAINHASATDTIDLRGTCVGNFHVTKSLTLRGPAVGATLQGNGGTTLAIGIANTGGAITVRLVRLFVTGGSGSSIPSAGGDRSSGGIYSGPYVTLTLVDSTVSGNSVVDPGDVFGGGILNDGDLHLLRSTVDHNRIDSQWAYGGGIYNSGDATATLIDSTVSRNVANGAAGSYGGGIDTGHDLTLTDVTIAGNHAQGGGSFGGGLYNDGTVTSTTVTATIIARNGAATGPDCAGVTSTSSGHNLIGIGASCAGFVEGASGDQVGTMIAPVDPLLGPLAHNGGLTRTRDVLAGSPAVDAAGDGPCSVVQDQRGFIRPQGTACDVGAVERQP